MADPLALEGVRSFAQLTGADRPQRRGSDELGKTQFLELMIAQLENQDPLDPSKNEEFVAQLAQFSSVEGIENLNNTVDDMAGAIRSSLTLEAASLVNREVLIPSNQAVVTDAGLAGQLDLPGGAAEVRVRISQLSGERVGELILGPLPAGVSEFTWDALDEGGNPLPAGLYRVNASYDRGEGEEAASLYLPNRVASVSVGAGGIQVDLLGGEQTTTEEIRQIR